MCYIDCGIPCVGTASSRPFDYNLDGTHRAFASANSSTSDLNGSILSRCNCVSRRMWYQTTWYGCPVYWSTFMNIIIHTTIYALNVHKINTNSSKCISSYSKNSHSISRRSFVKWHFRKWMGFLTITDIFLTLECTTSVSSSAMSFVSLAVFAAFCAFNGITVLKRFVRYTCGQHVSFPYSNNPANLFSFFGEN